MQNTKKNIALIMNGLWLGRLFSISKFRKLSEQSTFYSCSVYNYSCSVWENIIGKGLRQFFDLQPTSFSKVNELWIFFFQLSRDHWPIEGQSAGVQTQKPIFQGRYTGPAEHMGTVEIFTYSSVPNRRAGGNFFLKINKRVDQNKTVQGEIFSQK